MISKKLYHKIVTKINDSPYFNFIDFDLIKSSKAATLKYKFHNDYYWKIMLKTGHDLSKNIESEPEKLLEKYILVEYSPSDIMNKVVIEIQDDYDVIKTIHNWLVDLYEDLVQDPIVRKIENDIQEMNNFVNSININGNKDFSDEEIADWEDKLNIVQEKLKTEIEELKVENKNLKKSFNKIINEIDLLKSTLKSTKKTTWVKSVAFKLVTWMSNPNNQAILIDNVKEIKGMIEGQN